MGVGFWTLPGGIIGSGFAFKIEERNKIKKFNRLVPAAAGLIQNWWRVKVAFDIPTDNVTRFVSVLKAFKPDQKYSREGEKKRDLESLNQEQLNDDENEKINLIKEQKKELDNLTYVTEKLSPKNLIIIRTILVLKYFVAQRKFKSAHKPYDFSDAMEQYTKDNMDILTKIRELQRRLEQSTISLNNCKGINEFRGSIVPGSFEKSYSARKHSIFNNMQNTEERQTFNEEDFSLENRIDSIEKKLNQLLNLQLNRSKGFHKNSVL